MNDPVNGVDPLGLEYLSFNGIMRDGLNQMGEAITSSAQATIDVITNVADAIADTFKEDDRTISEQANQYVDWVIDASELNEVMNASPSHPIHWEKAFIWQFVAPLHEDYKWNEPWGHPFFPEKGNCSH